LASPQLAPANAHATLSEVNGEPALVVLDGRKVFLVLSVTVDQSQVSQVRAIGNPDKLKWVAEGTGHPKR
jgi:RNA polymerase sigma-70 factor (ECF subfamily)